MVSRVLLGNLQTSSGKLKRLMTSFIFTCPFPGSCRKASWRPVTRFEGMSFLVNNRSVLIPFTIYDDAGRKALTQLKCKYIYDEIVAEVNLCFDQFMFKLGQRIFQEFRKMAGG